LFYRETRSPRPVRSCRAGRFHDAARVFLDDARAILEHVEQAKAKAQRVARGDQGMIRIGFTGSASFNPIVPSVIQDYRGRYPGIAVSLVESGTSQLIDSIRAGRVDAAFIRTPLREVDGLVVAAILEEEMLIALPAGHALAASASLALAALSGEPFILFPRASGPELYDNILGACGRAGFSPNIVQQAPEIASTLNLIAAGEGVSIVPASMQHMQAQAVAYRTIIGAAPRAPLSLAYRSNEPSAAVRNLAALARRAAANTARDRLARAG
jgi:DNA-binding transcriptional LysR family regulator